VEAARASFIAVLDTHFPLLVTFAGDVLDPSGKGPDGLSKPVLWCFVKQENWKRLPVTNRR